MPDVFTHLIRMALAQTTSCIPLLTLDGCPSIRLTKWVQFPTPDRRRLGWTRRDLGEDIAEIIEADILFVSPVTGRHHHASLVQQD